MRRNKEGVYFKADRPKDGESFNTVDRLSVDLIKTFFVVLYNTICDRGFRKLSTE